MCSSILLYLNPFGTVGVVSVSWQILQAILVKQALQQNQVLQLLLDIYTCKHVGLMGAPFALGVQPSSCHSSQPLKCRLLLLQAGWRTRVSHL